MMCEVCKSNEAYVHITKIVNGVKQELNLCEACAKQFQGMAYPGNINVNSPFSFQQLIGLIIEGVNKSSTLDKSSNIKCEKCGTTYKDFKENGFLGCGECYKDFKNATIPVIKRVQGSIEHKGKIPCKQGKEIINKKRILELKEELKKTIESEEYEKAAEIRDLIRDMEKEG